MGGWGYDSYIYALRLVAVGSNPTILITLPPIFPYYFYRKSAMDNL